MNSLDSRTMSLNSNDTTRLRLSFGLDEGGLGFDGPRFKEELGRCSLDRDCCVGGRLEKLCIVKFV